MTAVTLAPTRRILLVDDHSRFRAAAGALLSRGGFEVIAEAATLADALRAIARTHPDVVLLDIGLPDGDGIDGAAQIAALADAPAVVLVSARRADAYGARLEGARACGFIAKDDLSAASVRALL